MLAHVLACETWQRTQIDRLSAMLRPSLIHDNRQNISHEQSYKVGVFFVVAWREVLVGGLRSANQQVEGLCESQRYAAGKLEARHNT